MENNETVFAKWSIDKTQTMFFASAITATFLVLFLASFYFIFLWQRSTNLILLVVPIIFFLLLVAALPEFFKSIGAPIINSEVQVTDKGIYRKDLGSKDDYKFVAWSQMSGYDVSYLASKSLLGQLFPRPNQFFIKSKFEDDNFSVSAYSEETDILRAYFQENNVPFGFVKSS